ncbi:hypothetical protein CAPTEDRAFT_188032 [Capitella teleta]|uniref:NACHT domain-containing protein n=1 Tax=Capitella teleta TaxID=283909 RepID=R7TEF5_CAPTE|nr:hypothetical protein CAPTEDRAFT_188032 [Capitella teleta]|eukprot:ELT89446.1 hypothetical protein CAPTEDRAFT_188032 [Capitella teleta]
MAGPSPQLHDLGEKIEFHQDELFAPHPEEKSSSAKRLKLRNPKRILVEGDPGMGKTTLCQNLAFRWGHEKCTGEFKCAPCVHSWTFVVSLNAANLKDFTDIHTAVHKHLLPKESSIHKLKAALKSSESKTLFIIDSYDEGFKDNVLLRDLIEGRVYANATLLLTSRPNYLKDHLKKAFDSKLSTYGFNREQKHLYVERFAKSKKENESKFEGLLNLINDDELEYWWNDEGLHRQHIISLCSNPLNLAIICLLICSDGLPDITNRTELYKSITKFLVKKASERMHRPLEEIEAGIIRPICRLSFEAYKRNEVSLSKVDLEKVGVEADDVLQSGFLTKKVKVSLLDDPVERFSFSHKTFLEYLAAKHLAQTPDDLKDWLQTIDAHEWEGEHGSLKSFFIDLLHGDSFVEASLVIMERFTFLHKTNTVHNFLVSCFLLELLRHLKAKKIILSPEMEDEFEEKCLSIVDDTLNDPIRDYDSVCNVIRITFATINQNAKPRDISMNLDTEAKHVVGYLRNLKEWPRFNLIIKCSDECDAMQRGLQGSFFNYAANQLSSNIPLASYKEDPTDFLRIALEQGLGNDIQGMEYIGEPKHLAQTPDDLKDWLQTIDAHEWEDEHKSLKSFFMDLLHGDTFVEASLVIMERFTFSHETNKFRNFPASCLLLELLRHLQAKKMILSPEMEDEFKEKCLSIINRTVNDSTNHYADFNITFATISQNAQPQDISMNLDTEAKHVIHYLRNLEKCPVITLMICCPIIYLMIEECDECDAMQRGLQGSFFKYAANQLSSNIPLASYKEDPNDFLRIALEQGLGNDIQGMEYKGRRGLQSFTRVALDKPLKTLKMNLRGLDSVYLEMLPKLLSNPQLKILHLSYVDACYMKHLLPLSRLDALDELFLHIKDMNCMGSQEIQYYEQILKMNKMQELNIGDYNYVISDELKSVLQRTIPTMTALKEIELHVERSFDFWSSAEDHLQLESFTLDVTSLKSDSFDNLCELIEKWTNLRSLCIERILNGVHLLNMFAAIAKCQMLNTLEILNAEIGDDFIDPLLEMLKSLKQLESLQLWSTKLSADGKQKIEDLAQQREKQLSVDF